MLKKVCLLLLTLLCAGTTAVWAGIPPLLIPSRVVRIATGLPTNLSRTMTRLSQFSVPGYGQLFAKIDRPILLQMDKYGLNIHGMIAVHESLYPMDKNLPKGMSDLYRLETNVADFITHPKYEQGWQSLIERTRINLFESALPAYLTTSSENELVLPSASQLTDMIAFYRSKCRSGSFPADIFAKQMSAVTNLGLFGTVNDSDAILLAAQADFGSLNMLKDPFITRALLNLGAYDALQELADIRLNELDPLTKKPMLLSSVWTGVKQTLQKSGFRLTIPQDRISTETTEVPNFFQTSLIVHHPFNYVLVNTSAEVTHEWLNLRAELDEMFNRAAQTMDVTALPRAIIFRPTTQPVASFTTPTEPQNLIQESEAESEFSAEESIPEPEILSQKPITRNKIQKATAPKQSKQPKEPAPKKEPASVKKTSPQKTKAESPYAKTLAELEIYLTHQDHLPSAGTLLRKRINYARQKGNPQDVNVQQITLLLNSNLQKTRRTPKAVRAELEEYINQHDGDLPPTTLTVRKRAMDVRKKGDPTDPDVQTITQLLEQKAQHTYRSPAKLRQELETYLQENNGQYPPNNHALNKAIRRMLKKNPTNEDKDIAVIRALWNKHLKDVRAASSQRISAQNDARKMNSGKQPTYQEEGPTDKQRHPLNPARVLEELEQYIQEHNGELPPNRHPLRTAAYKVKQRGNPQDQNVRTVIDLLQTHKQRNGQLPDPKQVLAELQNYFAHSAELPPANTTLSRQFYKLESYGNAQNPDMQALITLWNSHKQDRTTPVFPVRAELEQYLCEHDGQIPPYRHPVRVRAEYRIQTGDPDDPDIIFMKNVLEGQKQKKIKRTPQNVLEDVTQYLAQHDGQLPPHGGALQQAIRAILKKFPNDPITQQLDALIKSHQKRPSRS